MGRRTKSGSRVQVDELRVDMELFGADTETIAGEIARRFGYRPRQAWRMALGWDQVEAAARYNGLVQSRGPQHDGRDTMTPSRVSEYERWPGSSRRPSVYVLATLAELYQTSLVRLLDHEDLRALDPAERAALLPARPSAATVANYAPPARARRRSVEAAISSQSLEEIVSSAAEESTQAALTAAATNVGPGTIEMLQQQVTALVADAELVPPGTTVSRAVGIRDIAVQLLQGRQWPGQTRDLYAVAAVGCALLGWVSGDLGQHYAALRQVGAAWTFAQLADNTAASAAVRAAQAKVSYWAGDIAASARYARIALEELGSQVSGTVSVLLASLLARAEAQVGAHDHVQAALSHALAQRDRVGDPDEHAGLISCSPAGQHCFAAGAWLTLGDPVRALAEAAQVEQAHQAGGAYRSLNMARVTALVAYLTRGDLDGATAEMTKLASLPADRRVATLGMRLNRGLTLLGNGQYAGSNRAHALREEIGEFCRSVTVARALPQHQAPQTPR